MANINAINNRSYTLLVDNALTVTTGGATITGNSSINTSGTGTCAIGSGTATGDINIGTSTGDQNINIGFGAANKSIILGVANGTTRVDIESGSGGVIVNSVGGSAVVGGSTGATIDSAAGPIGVGSGNTNNAVNIGTLSTAGRTITIGNATGTTAVNITAGSGKINFTGAITSATPIPVAAGGTGDASVTAYAVLCGGTTSTNPFQSIASVGTSGQVLTSNGAGALPTFQAASGGGISTIAGNSGSATGSTVTFNASSQAGATITFTGSSATVSLNTTDASNNTTLGLTAGNSTMLANGANQNAGFGYEALKAATSAANNTMLGCFAGLSITTGNQNTGVGSGALAFITTGGANTALGYAAGEAYVTGTESNNICIGNGVQGTNGESNVLRIGTGTGTGTGQLNKAFIAGIQTITVTGTAVLVSSSDQLGIAVSSRKYKDNIVDMADEPLMKLRPVNFNYKDDESKAKQWGLIAEEVMEIMPELVVLKDNEPFTVKYLDLIPMLLNEVQKLRKELNELKRV